MDFAHLRITAELSGGMNMPEKRRQRRVAQRGRTINIPTWCFPIIGTILLFLNKNEK
jgi:hypothetical protein